MAHNDTVQEALMIPLRTGGYLKVSRVIGHGEDTYIYSSVPLNQATLFPPAYCRNETSVLKHHKPRDPTDRKVLYSNMMKPIRVRRVSTTEILTGTWGFQFSDRNNDVVNHLCIRREEAEELWREYYSKFKQAVENEESCTMALWKDMESEDDFETAVSVLDSTEYTIKDGFLYRVYKETEVMNVFDS